MDVPNLDDNMRHAVQCVCECGAACSFYNMVEQTHPTIPPQLR